MEAAASVEAHDSAHDESLHKAALTPPTSEDMDKRERSSSPLSDMELDNPEEEDIGEIEPDHYWDGGKIPVFKPTMAQFRSFKKFIDKIDTYGMKSGIVKVIPPKEWIDSLPALHEAVKTIKVKNPITQEFVGTHGVYTQNNMEKQRSYNLPQWKAVTEESNHQPPAKRGDRRANRDAVGRTRSTRSGAASSADSTTGQPDGPKRKPGRPRKRPAPEEKEDSPDKGADSKEDSQLQVPPTPTSPDTKPPSKKRARRSTAKTEAADEDDSPTKPRGRQPKSKSVSSRRLNNRREAADEIDEKAFKNFDYHFGNVDEFTPERCKELEEVYWKTLNYGQPMYGADMPGSLFDDNTTSWNVAKLENLLDVLGTKVPGVNTAYLYLGMWKATFAWHLEDVDLYSINYIHFGAPKQWYSISQADARRFEAAMKSIWPTDAKACDQFLRHKTYLISPDKLEKQFGIKVNRLVHYEGEFVITYPYGYHSGYNLGYNCAESVNFATEAWLPMGRVAKKCDCEADSVWVDVSEIERKLRGEPTPEYWEEVTDDEDDDEEVEDEQNDLPSPPASVAGKIKTAPKKRKRETKEATEQKVKKKIKIRILPSKQPCVLCPNDVSYDKLLPTDNGQRAHRLCALYTPETYLVEENGREKVCGVPFIEKARFDLKCNHCGSKRGTCFQCSSKKCTRAFHATCAAAAGVQIDTGPVPTFDEDGTEYYCEGYDFRCRFHRPKKRHLKFVDVESLENKFTREYGRSLKSREVIQAQYLDGGEVFAGIVVENRPSEMTVLVDILPEGPGSERVEIEYKWLLYIDPADSLRPKPSANAKPLPEHLLNNKSLDAKNQKDPPPVMDEPFHDPNCIEKWAEFHTCTAEEARNPEQKKIDFSKPDQIWFYLGKTSTEARQQYTEDPTKPRHNPKGNFLDTVKPPPPPPAPVERRSLPAAYPSGVNVKALNATSSVQRQQQQQSHDKQPAPKQAPMASVTMYGAQYGQPKEKQRPVQPAPMTQQSQQSRYSSAQAQYAHPKYHSTPYSRNPAQEASKIPYQTSPYPNSAKLGAPSIDPRLDQPSSRPQYQYYQPPSDQQQPQPQPQRQYQYPHTYSNQPGQHQAQQRVALVAPMLGAKASSPSALFSYPSNPTTDPSPPQLTHSSSSSSSTSDRLQHINDLKNYPYLLHSFLRRPQKYQSPYRLPKDGGGFTEAYQPTSLARPSSSHSHYPQPGPHSSYASNPYPNPAAANVQPDFGFGCPPPSSRTRIRRADRATRHSGQA
ncbi:hypothetical protein H2199_005095 [Coniosporium tulheliwenetii]|uniref:Uncharacterized protein n=1 Tax=Coniosporium tulheliwenetii TaxID=3383036 RepID=A0ACC2Z3H6_9PEZI|nr:hypothetical protein H2199_005095 [Cladosporium sp. JES 115]